MSNSGLFDIGLRIKDAFFDREFVRERLTAACAGPLSKAGAYVRQRARSSLRPPRRMRFGELDPRRQTVFEIRKRIAIEGGTELPQLPFAVSQPGEPPRSPTGRLRESIFFAFDADNLSTVVGPIKLSSRGENVPATLEEGGQENVFGRSVKYEARPFMGPALEKEIGKLPELFEGIF